jgi:hypothetical protein
MCRLRHINDPVLSSLKMEGRRFFFHIATLVLFCKSKGHFLVFLNLFFPKTDLFKGGLGGGHPIRNPLILGFLLKEDI